jgi:hypothetical protein
MFINSLSRLQFLEFLEMIALKYQIDGIVPKESLGNP